LHISARSSQRRTKILHSRALDVYRMRLKVLCQLTQSPLLLGKSGEYRYMPDMLMQP
jgi:hypothetical protein